MEPGRHHQYYTVAAVRGGQNLSWCKFVRRHMPTLLFTVAPAAVAHIHDLLACLARFDEDIGIEATPQFLRISSLNISKTAHAAFTLNAAFFSKYHFSAGPRNLSAGLQPKQWLCKLQNRALSSIFKRRLGDQREKDTGLENCECELQASTDVADCRLVFRLNCRQGVVKTYRLYYEAGEILHATFDQMSSINYWTASSRTLRDVVEYFGPKTDQLDWSFHAGKVTFTSYTEKIQAGREILKQPTHTSVALERKDFTDFNVQEGLHIGTMVKDFRAIVAHAETMRTQVTARYSRGNRPMQISYGEGDLKAEFTLMTRGSSNVPSTASHASTTATPVREISMRPISRPPDTPATTSGIASHQQSVDAGASMRPPTRSMLQDRGNGQPRRLDGEPTESDTVPAPSASIDPNSLFIPADDDDHQWDEPNFEDEPDIVTWDNAADDAMSVSNSSRRIRDLETHSFASVAGGERPGSSSDRLGRSRFPSEIAPTQRLSQFKGIFD